MPGIDISTSTRSGPASDATDEDATYFVAGLTERGPVDEAVVLRSLTEYVQVFGDRVSYGTLYDDLRTHFEEGGVRAAVARTVGAGATVGLLALKDGSAGAGLNTLRIDARNPGAHSTRLTVEVLAGAIANTFTLVIRYDGVVVETWRDLASPAAADAALDISRWVRAVDLGSATAAPGNNPRVLAATALSAGTDDRASVVAATHVAALARFDEDGVDPTGRQVALGTGIVAIPGQPSSAVAVGLAAHAASHSRIAITAVAVAASQAAAIAAAGVATDAIVAAGGEPQTTGLAWPGVKIPDVGGVVRTITPEGYVAACRARAVAGDPSAGVPAEGPWRAPAGELAEARFILGPEVQVDRAAGDLLDAARVSAIRPIAGGTRLYGWRSLSTDEANWRLLTSRDVLNKIEIDAGAVLEGFVFRTIDADERLLAQVNAALVGVLDPMAVAGGLFPRDDDDGYSVDTGPSINTLQSLQANQLGAEIAARPSPTAELIKLSIVKAALTAAV